MQRADSAIANTPAHCSLWTGAFGGGQLYSVVLSKRCGGAARLLCWADVACASLSKAAGSGPFRPFQVQALPRAEGRLTAGGRL